MAVPEGTATSGADSNASGTTFDQAFDSAVEEHAGGDSGAGAGDTTREDGTTSETTEEADRSDDTSTEDGKDETAETEEAGAGGDGSGDEPPVAALLAKLSPELRKEWNRVFTQKTQKIAGQERLLEALSRDPETVARKIIERVEEAKKAAGTDDERPAITKESLVEKFKKIPGVNDVQANALADIQLELVEHAIGPINARFEQQAIDAEESLIDSTLDAFKKDHPEFEEIEAEMGEMMDSLPRGENVPYRKYLDLIHALVVQDTKVAARVKRVVEKINKNAKSVGNKPKPVSETHVQSGTKGKLRTFDESADAALRGETYGRGISR